MGSVLSFKKLFFFSGGSDNLKLLSCRLISVIPNLEDKTKVVSSLEENKPIKCKTMLLFCLPDWESVERDL